MKKLLIITSLILMFLVAGQESYAQCAMCRGSVESSMGNGRNNVGIGLNTGIVYLFVMPYLIVAVIGYLWYKNSRKIRQEREFISARIKQAYPS